jgi:MSHA pilin protein MshD
MLITNHLAHNFRATNVGARQRGVTLVELIVFIVVVSIAFTVLMSVYIQSARTNVNPVVQIRLLEAAQSKLDEVMALKYDEATPTGGLPACNSPGGMSCTNLSESNMNDVDDFHGVSDAPYINYQRTVTVSSEAKRKLITVTVTAPDGQSVALSAYRYNF